MSANADAAAQCAAKGVRALAEGDADAAVRLLRKAQKLGGGELSGPLLRKLEEAEALVAASPPAATPASDSANSSSSSSFSYDGSGAGGGGGGADAGASTPVDENANREQAEICAARGAAAFNDGDAATAVKFLTRALRLCSTLGPKVRGQLRAAEQTLAARAGSGGGSGFPAAGAATSAAAAAAAAASSSAAGVRRRPAGAGAGSGAAASAEQRPFTPEMAEVVRQIKSAKDLYAVLGVARDADEDAIKRAYKKLALKVHPDKNSAPGADEAFKRVGTAVTKLTNGHERADYDRSGEENGGGAGAGGGGGGGGSGDPRGQHYRQRREQELSPEDIFNAFFGGGLGGMGGQVFQGADGRFRIHRRGPQQAQQGHEHEHHQGEDGGGGLNARLAQAWPLLLLLLFALLNFGGGGDDQWYSLRQTRSHSVQRATAKWAGVVPGLPYWVRDTVDTRLRTDQKVLYEVELNVQSDLRRSWTQACREETELRRVYESYARNAHLSSDRRTYEKKLRELATPGCDNNEKFFGAGAASRRPQGGESEFAPR